MKQSELEGLPWQEVESSNIARVAWVNTGEPVAVEAEERLPLTGKLYVEFHGSGSVYAYAGVRKEQFEELVEADSVGGYFNAEVKGSHDFERVRVEAA